MVFKPGTKVLCTKSTDNFTYNNFTEGKTYTVIEYDKSLPEWTWVKKDDNGNENCWFTKYFVDKERHDSDKAFNTKFDSWLAEKPKRKKNE